jgi:hypothetical protein
MLPLAGFRLPNSLCRLIQPFTIGQQRNQFDGTEKLHRVRVRPAQWPRFVRLLKLSLKLNRFSPLFLPFPNDWTGGEGQNRAPLGTNDIQLWHILQVIQADCVTIKVLGFHLVC